MMKYGSQTNSIFFAVFCDNLEPRNMAYMERLGIWGKGTQFSGFTEFLQSIESRGVGAMELLAMDMRRMGM